jgi:hypothetical protein
MKSNTESNPATTQDEQHFTAMVPPSARKISDVKLILGRTIARQSSRVNFRPNGEQSRKNHGLRGF